MKHQVFSIYDQKASAFITPFFMPENEMAIRIFSDAVNDPVHQFGKHPSDYTLFNIGEYDDNSGALTAIKTHINLGIGIQFKRTGSDFDQAFEELSEEEKIEEAQAWLKDHEPQKPTPIGKKA